MGKIHLTIDGKRITVPEGTTILGAAALHGIDIPTLCHVRDRVPTGACRVCVVEVEGARALASLMKDFAAKNG